MVKHAQTDRAEVALRLTDESVSLLIEDHGVGFDSASIGLGASRLGLNGMRERAEMLGGTFTVESRPGAGTRIWVEIPQSQEG